MSEDKKYYLKTIQKRKMEIIKLLKINNLSPLQSILNYIKIISTLKLAFLEIYII